MNGRILGSEGKELARKALELMEDYDIPPSPENYAVWVSYVSDSNADLCDSVRSHIENGDTFDETICADLFEQYFQLQAIQDAILEGGTKMSAELGAVHESLAAVERDTADYGRALAGATSQLSDATDADGMKKMVESLVSATAKMQRRSQTLERKLQETSAEVTALRSNLEKVREEAMTDALTGVANRKRFDEFLRRARREAENDGAPMSLLLCDIDFFKRFNDTWGHQTGDQIIRFVAGCLTRHTTDAHLVSRYGGEEFGIVMPKTSVQDAVAIAEQIRKTVESKKLLRKSTNEDLGNITISLGAAEYIAGESIEDLIERTDTALYKSKTEGRNQTTAASGADATRSAA